jgi:methylmalonyl-CoA mutase N-terminal domain/subunit
VDERVEVAQKERLQKLRAERSPDAVARALDALRGAARSPKENLIPRIYDAVRAEATLGEVSDALRDVFGEHRENVVL